MKRTIKLFFNIFRAALLTPAIPLIALWVNYHYPWDGYISCCKQGFKIFWTFEEETA